MLERPHPAGQAKGSHVKEISEEPTVQDGKIHYGHGKMDACSFKTEKKESDKTSPKAVVAISLTTTDGKDIDLEAVSQVQGKVMEYKLKLKQKAFASTILIEWEAASSKELSEVLRKAHGGEGKYMRLKHDTGEVNYEVPLTFRPVLRNGTIIVKNPDGKTVGAAHAPAYGPPK
jgi:hypothetical protein